MSDELVTAPESGDSEPVVESPAIVEVASAVDVEQVAREAARVEAENDAAVDRELRRLTRRGFLVAGISAGIGYGGWRWLRSRAPIGSLAWPLRRTLET